MSQIVPDNKNWTVVLESVCGQCSYDVRGVALNEVAAQLPHCVAPYVRVLSRPEAQTDPVFPDWDQDQAAEAGGYNALSASQAAEKLRAAASKYVAKLQSIDPSAYGRRGLRSNGAALTIETLTQYAWHDVVHHLWDLTGQAR